MDSHFWLERWRRNEIGFHQPGVNDGLLRHWPSLGCRPGERVFVPLAGKSHDLAWLHEQGLEVVGVEVSEVAVRDFFREHGLRPHIDELPGFTRFAAAGIELLCGDYFALGREALGRFSAVYDRASLVAFPADMRPRYVAQMNELCASGTRTLLITLEYEQPQMKGPPFAVSEAEVRETYGLGHDVRLLERNAHLPDFAKFAARGVTHLAEAIYRLERR